MNTFNLLSYYYYLINTKCCGGGVAAIAFFSLIVMDINSNLISIVQNTYCTIHKTLGDDQSQHYQLHSQNQHHQHQRPPSEHIYFSIESDYNSTNAGNEFINSSGGTSTSAGQSAAIANTATGVIALNAQKNSIHRPSIAAQQWRLTSNHKNSSTSSSSSSPQPHMV